MKRIKNRKIDITKIKTFEYFTTSKYYLNIKTINNKKIRFVFDDIKQWHREICFLENLFKPK